MTAIALSETTRWHDGLRTPEGGFRLSSPAIDSFFDWAGYHDGVNVPLRQDEIFSDGPGGARQWIFKRPWELLSMPLRDTCCALEKICVGGTDFASINESFGDRWGSKATYIVVPTNFVYGLNGVARLLPSLPPSRNGTATCVILYGALAPYHMEQSSYCWDLCRGLDPNLICPDPVEGRQFTGEVNLHMQAVCDLAHARGIKMGFSMRTSSEQMWFGHGDWNERFSWWNDHHFAAYVEAAKNLINLGMDAIYLDSAFLSGQGGEWMPLERLSQFTNAVRGETSRGRSVAIIGEGCDRHWEHWKNLGLSAGFHSDVTGGFGDNEASEIAHWQSWNDEYRSGWHTRVDNDCGTPDHIIRRGVSLGLTGQAGVSRTPGMLSLTDFYLLDDTNIHELIENGRRWDDDWRWHGCFQNSHASYRQQLEMNDIFLQGAVQWEP